MLPEVIFRVKEKDGEIRLYVAYLFQDALGRLFAVLSQNEDGHSLEHSAMLDSSLLVKQTDNVSDRPYYLYRGVVDAHQLTSQMQPKR